MMRIAPWIVAVALLVGVTSTASAQVNLTFGNPIAGRGATLSFGQPGITGYNYGYGQPGYVGSPYYGGVTSPYAGYPGYGYTTIAPYTTGTTYYSSGYTGYVAPGTTIYQQRTYPSYPLNYSYGYGPGYRAGTPYGSGVFDPYGRGVMNLNRGFGLRIR